MRWVEHDDSYYRDLQLKKNPMCKIEDLRPFDLFSSKGKTYMLVGGYENVEGNEYVFALEGAPELGKLSVCDFELHHEVKYIGDLIVR